MAKTKKQEKVAKKPGRIQDRAAYQRDRRARIAKGELVPKQYLLRDGKLTAWASGLSKKELKALATERGQLDAVKPYL